MRIGTGSYYILVQRSTRYYISMALKNIPLPGILCRKYVPYCPTVPVVADLSLKVVGNDSMRTKGGLEDVKCLVFSSHCGDRRSFLF